VIRTGKSLIARLSRFFRPANLPFGHPVTSGRLQDIRGPMRALARGWRGGTPVVDEIGDFPRGTSGRVIARMMDFSR